MRSPISLAAFSVKVRAKMCFGSIFLSRIRCFIRSVITVVLPVPAPAIIRRGPPPCEIAASCSGLRSFWSVMTIIVTYKSNKQVGFLSYFCYYLCMARKYTVKLLRKEKLAKDTWLFAFEKPEGYIFLPGQYQTFTLSLPN